MRKRGVSEDSKAFGLRLWKEEVAFSEGKTAGGGGHAGRMRSSASYLEVWSAGYARRVAAGYSTWVQVRLLAGDVCLEI